MKELELSQSEKDLCKHARQGKLLELRPTDTIQAEVIQRLVLGLPFDKETGLIATIASFFDESHDLVACSKAVIGIRIKSGIIKDRLDLHAATGADGVPLCPLEFSGCRFEGGFAGAHGHFSRLRFDRCRFGDMPDPAGGPVPLLSVDLTGAAVDSDLEFPGCRPLDDDTEGSSVDEAYFEDARGVGSQHHFWIGLTGSRIDGTVDFSRARLRAPLKQVERCQAANAVVSKPERTDALNFSQSEIAGDLRLVGGRSLGRIFARAAEVNGDVWMTGARLNGDGGAALVLQSLTVKGFVVLRGGYRSECDEDVRDRFAARGEINFHGARLGAKLRIGDVDLFASSWSAPDRPPSQASPDDDVCLCLEGARVDGSIDISPDDSRRPSYLCGRVQLAYLEVANEFHIKNARFGARSGTGFEDCVIDLKLLVAKELLISNVAPFPQPPGIGTDAPYWRPISLDLQGARTEALRVENSHLGGCLSARSIHCRGDAEIGTRIDGRLDLTGCSIGGSLDLSKLAIRDPVAMGGHAELCVRDATVARTLRVSRDAESDASPSRHLFPDFGRAYLEGLTCNTLDDDIGRSWGSKAVIRMNHLTYRRTGWLSEERPELGTRRRGKPSYRIVSDWIQSRRADGLFPWRFFPRWLLSRDEHFWEPWQLRRNWIYQHYPARRMRAAIPNPFVSIVRHRIREDDYRPQPFEQAIKVARAEGREDFANQVEMHKQRLEWRFLNQRVRWALGIVAIILSALWLSIRSNTATAMLVTGGAAIISLVLMIFGSSIRRLVRQRVVVPLLSPRNSMESAHAAFAVVLLPLWFFLSGLVAWMVGALLAAYVAIWVAIFGSSVAAGAAGPFVSGRQVVRAANMSSKFLTWLAYYVPAIALLFLCGWYAKPFHYIIAFLIFVAIRLTTVIAHMIMRFGFGYMRRPIYAVTTLIAAFLAGWGGVVVAKQRDMFVISAEPMAGLVATVQPGNVVTNGAQAEPPTPMGRESAEHHEAAFLLSGSEGATGHRFVRDVSCSHEISEPLYALDVLIPIVDLGEERRCEIRRFPAPGRMPVEPSEMKFRPLIAAIPDLPLNDHRFWWWMKALYAIFGWVIVSLAILTFAQVNKIHAEPPTEHK